MILNQLCCPLLLLYIDFNVLYLLDEEEELEKEMQLQRQTSDLKKDLSKRVLSVTSHDETVNVEDKDKTKEEVRA